MTGGFHHASDTTGGEKERRERIAGNEDMFEIRIMRMKRHLNEIKDIHSLLRAVELYER